MKRYLIIDDSGVDYKFIKGFGLQTESWKGQVVEGYPSPHLEGHVTINKPFGLVGTYTAPDSHFEELISADC